MKTIKMTCVLAAAFACGAAFADSPILADDLIWLPIGDSITEGETWMGHADLGDVNSRGGYRYQLWHEMEEVAGQPTVSVGYRTGHQSTVEDPATCRWAWHAAQYGGVIMHDNNGSHGAAGLCVESTLEVAGYPDVITVLIGVNDCSMTNSSDDQIGKVFQTWVNMLTKLSALRPKSTICVSTLLPAGGGRDGYIGKFNALVRAAATAKASPFDCANVVFADMNQDAFGGTYDSQYFKGDNLHPNENGAKLIGSAFAKYLKDAATTRATHAAELVSVDNGTAGFVTVRFNKALQSVTSATLTIAGTNVAGETVNLELTDCAIDATNKRLLKFVTSDALQGGTYTATLTNLAGTDGNELALPATLTLDDSKFVEILGTGAEANVPASLRKGLTKHGTLTMADGAINNGIGAGDNFAGNGPGNQFDVANVLPPYVKRVAYYMELKRPGQPAQFVWASMDATTGFSSNAARIGIPTTSSGNVKALVNNLQVYGNRGNFTNSEIDADGNSADVGIVEFSPYDWTAADQSGFPQDFNANYNGWNDTLGTSTLKGCMQVAKVLRTSDFDNYTKPGAEMLFAYNNFNRASTTDLAIGSFSTHRHNNGNQCTVVNDWTDFVSLTAYEKFAVNAYEVKNLEIWFEEGEEPEVLDIPAGSIVIKSASDPLTVPVTGEGRLVLDNYLPTDSAVLESLQDATHWTGTVEIRNYAPTANYGIIYFQNYANANSTVALNGVTATMYTGKSGHPDQTFGALEITGAGWTTGTGDFTVDPLYNCNLKGSGPITINHRGKSGVVNFCGDHSGFTGTINFVTDADKGVALAPAGTGRTTGIPAKTIKVLAGATVGISGTTNGTIVGEGTIVADGAMPTALQANLQATTWTGTLWLKNITTNANRNPSLLGNSGSTVRYTNVSGWLNSGAYACTVEVVNDANGNGLTITDGSSGWDAAKVVKFARLTGAGTLKLNWGKTYPLHLPDVSGFTGSINCAQANGIGVIIGADATIAKGGNGKIAVLDGMEATIASGATWTAPNGVVVEGTLGVDGTLQSEVSGSGCLGYTKFNKVHANVKTGLKKAAWTGTIVITGDGAINEGTVDGSAYTTLNEYGSEASKIELAGTCSGYFGLSTKTGSEATPTVVQPELVVSGTWSQNSGYSQASNSRGYCTIFRKVSGTGTMSSPSGKPKQLYYIEDASDFKGSLEALAGKFVIGSREDSTLVTDGTITIKDGKTISAGRTWKASAGITLGGTVDFAVAPAAGDVALANGVSNGTVTLAETAAYMVSGDIGTKLQLKVDGSRIVLAATYPEYVDVNDPKQVEAYDTWKATHADTLATATALQAKEAYFLNCAPTAEALTQAERDFKLTISIDAAGKVTVSPPEGYHVTPEIKGSSTVDGEYNLPEDDETARFFKAFITL